MVLPSSMLSPKGSLSATHLVQWRQRWADSAHGPFTDRSWTLGLKVPVPGGTSFRGSSLPQRSPAESALQAGQSIPISGPKTYSYDQARIDVLHDCD